MRAAIWKENSLVLTFSPLIVFVFCFVFFFRFPRVQIAVDSRDMFFFISLSFDWVCLCIHEQSRPFFFFIFCFSLIGIFCTAAAAAHTILRLIQFSTLIPSLRAVYMASSLLHSQCNIHPRSTRERCTTPIESLHNNQAANQIRPSLNSIKRKGDRRNQNK